MSLLCFLLLLFLFLFLFCFPSYYFVFRAFLRAINHHQSHEKNPLDFGKLNLKSDFLIYLNSFFCLKMQNERERLKLFQSRHVSYQSTHDPGPFCCLLLVVVFAGGSIVKLSRNTLCKPFLLLFFWDWAAVVVLCRFGIEALFNLSSPTFLPPGTFFVGIFFPGSIGGL